MGKNVVLADRIEMLVTSMGYEFVGCELQAESGRSLLRVYIDRLKGVSIEDCTQISRQLSAMLDVEDPLPGRYTLEVSSPGINRPLFNLKQYEKFIGFDIKVRLVTPIENRINFVGRLNQIKGTDIFLQVETTEVVIPFGQIKKANLVTDISIGKLN